MAEDVHSYGVEPCCCLVLASGNPRCLAGFYTELFAGAAVTAASDGTVTVHLPTGMDMVLYQRTARCAPLRHSSGLALCLRCAHLEGTRQRAMELGARVLEPVRTESFGWEQWLLDPEENRVLLWEEPATAVRKPHGMSSLD